MPDLYLSVFLRERFVIESGAHDDNVLIIVLDGSFEVSFGDVTQVVCEGEICHFPRGVPFSRRVITPLRLIYAESCTEIDMPIGRVDFCLPERVTATAKLIEHCLEDGLLAEACELFSDLLRQYAIESKTVHRRTSCEVESFIARTRIGGERMLVGEFARSVGMSENGFIKLFSREMGVTPHVYLSRMRINRCKSLLLSTDMSMSEIAAECGFENPYYFSNAFRRHTGVSPTKYRMARRKL
jgi:AraC-like DNA-binding protein